MKLTLCALLVCLLGVNALVVPQPNEVYDLFETDEALPLDAESFGIFSSTWWAIKGCLRTVKGFNCMIKWVVGIEESASTYNLNVMFCALTASQDVTNLINANRQIISNSNDIIHLSSNVCNGTQSTPPSLSKSCTVQTLSKVFSLYKSVKSAVTLAKKIPQTGPNAVSCVNDATNQLISYYTQFPQNIKNCSKLTS